MRNTLAVIHWVICIVALVGIVAQFLFAGMGVFHASGFTLHEDTGEAITFVAYLILLLSLAGWLGRARIGLSALLVVLMLVQGLLVHASSPWVQAFHPLNGLAVMGVAATLVKMGTRKSKARATERS